MLSNKRLRELLAMHDADECGGGCVEAAAYRELIVRRSVCRELPDVAWIERQVAERLGGGVEEDAVAIASPMSNPDTQPE